MWFHKCFYKTIGIKDTLNNIRRNNLLFLLPAKAIFDLHEMDFIL